MLRILVLFLASMLFTGAAQSAERRVALVVGASRYKMVPTLRNTLNDAQGMAAALKRLGFDVETLIDPDRQAFEVGLRTFGGKAGTADVALFFYAGHALEAVGRNWLLPVSAEIHNSRDLSFEAIDLDLVIGQLDGARLSVIMLDACRDNPFKLLLGNGGRGLNGGGLAPLQAAAGTLVVFSTAPGTVAADGSGPNSPFTTALLHHIEEEGVEVRQVLAEVRRDVREATAGRQIPWEQSAMEGTLYFKPALTPVTAPLKPPIAGTALPRTQTSDDDRLYWESVRNSTSRGELQAYIERFPNGTFVDLARSRMAAMTGLDQPFLRKLAEEIPGRDAKSRADIARRYLDARRSKALAISADGKESWRAFDWSTDDLAQERALEGCQVMYGAPCRLLAVNETIQAKPAEGNRAPHDMARVRYAGTFDPAQIPNFSEGRRQSAQIVGYTAAAPPKAIAYHPWGRAFVVSGTASDTAAQSQALANCRADPDRNGADGPCYLYAIGNQVVLPQRRTSPVAVSRSITE